MYGLIQAKYLREEDPQRIAGRVIGVAFGVVIFIAGVWWRQWMEMHDFIREQGMAIVVAALGLTIATTFVIRRPYLMTVILALSALPFLYLLTGGLVGFGVIYDFWTLNDQVTLINSKT